jgi:predicted Zn finger-like uncharacterized protein
MATDTKIKTRCPNCSASYKVPAKAAGRQVKCIRCQTSFRVRELSTSKYYPPTEDDILRWLNEALERDERHEERFRSSEEEAQGEEVSRQITTVSKSNTPQQRDSMKEDQFRHRKVESEELMAFRKTG